MSKNIVFEGWLTKSPPTKRIWRTKWRRRWFALRQSGELPGQYFLDYYADRNCRRLKGTINLDLCEQVDAGLHMERSNNGTLDPKLRGSVFTIQTQSRTYHLEADCEAEMEKWVDIICRVCGLRATDDSANVIELYQTNVNSVAATNEHYESTNNTGPYIPISECITGVKAQGDQRSLTCNSKNIVVSQINPLEKVLESRGHQMYLNQPHIKANNPEISENESNFSDEDCKSLNASQSNIRDWSVAKTFTKLAITPKNNEPSEEGPPVPPRPPKTLAMKKDIQKDITYQGPKIHEPTNTHFEHITGIYRNTSRMKLPRCVSHGAPNSPGRSFLTQSAVRYIDEEEEFSPGLMSMQYCNLPSLPPAIDRALKPRYVNHTVAQIHFSGQTGLRLIHREAMKPDVLQYLDLDLHTSQPDTDKFKDKSRKRTDVIHGKSLSEADSPYKTVDFLKTEAFNITRQDVEASRLKLNY